MRRLASASPLRGPLRAVYRSLVNWRGVAVRVDGVSLRLLPGSEPRVAAAGASDVVQQLDDLFLRVFYDAVGQGDWVADVGAFMGTYGILASLRTGAGGHVFAFEPSAESCRSIARNLQWNRLTDRVSVHQAAVCDVVGEAEFFSHGSSSTNSFFREAFSESERGVGELTRQTVSTLDLDSFFATRGRDPDVVKIDIEGAELSALRGARRILAGPATVFCEFHPYAWFEAGHSADDLTSWLHEQGREIVDLTTGKQSTGPYRYGPYLLRRRTTGESASSGRR